MYVVFDYECAKCELIAERMGRRSECEKQFCDMCGSPMTRLPAGTRTTFKFADRTASKT